MKLLPAITACVSFLFTIPALAGTSEVALPVDSTMSEIYVSAQTADAMQTLTHDDKQIDPTYLELARATGGQVIMLDPQSMGTSAGQQVLQQMIAGTSNRESVLMAERTLEGTGLPFAATLTRPDGSVVKVGEQNIVTNQTDNGQIWTIAAPAPGIWKLQLSGSGTLSVSLMAKTPLFLLSARYVRLGGDGVHQGYFPADDQNPPSKTSQQVELSLGGDEPLSELNFIIQDAQGKQLERLDRAKHQSTDGSEAMFDMRVPEVPYRFAVLAKDRQGNIVQRTYSGLFSPIN